MIKTGKSQKASLKQEITVTMTSEKIPTLLVLHFGKDCIKH